MTKVTVNPPDAATSPSAELMKQVSAEFHVRDAQNRTITLKKPGALAQYRLVEALGGKAASNQVYMGMVLPLIYVVAIDGLPVPPPSSKDEVEALIQRLDDDGLAAIAKGIEERFGAQDPEADREALKK